MRPTGSGRVCDGTTGVRRRLRQTTILPCRLRAVRVSLVSRAHRCRQWPSHDASTDARSRPLFPPELAALILPNTLQRPLRSVPLDPALTARHIPHSPSDIRDHPSLEDPTRPQFQTCLPADVRLDRRRSPRWGQDEGSDGPRRTLGRTRARRVDDRAGCTGRGCVRQHAGEERWADHDGGAHPHHLPPSGSSLAVVRFVVERRRDNGGRYSRRYSDPRAA